MDSPSRQPDPPRDAAEPSAVEAMLDRPVGQVVRFLCQSVVTWVWALLDPWRLGKAANEGSDRLAPPFAFLVTMFFAAGVTMRLWRSLAITPLSVNESILTDLRFAVGDVSLAGAVLITFPCVLLVAGGARLLSRIARGPRRFDDDRLVTVACYAVGWQAGMVAALASLFVVLQMAGFDPVGSLYDEVNTLAPYVAGWMTLWGALAMFAPLRDRFPRRRWWPAPLTLAMTFVASAVALFGGMGTLSESADFTSAARGRALRQLDALHGDLSVELIHSRPVSREPERYEMTLAYSSRSESLVIVPRQEELTPPEEAHEKFHDGRLRVLASSIDLLPDRALLIEPGQTRVAQYTVELVAPGATEISHRPRATPYSVAYHLREPEGYFSENKTIVWAPGVARR